MRQVYWLIAAFCLTGCRTPEPPPQAGGVRIDVPFVRIRVADSPEPTVIGEELPKKAKGF